MAEKTLLKVNNLKKHFPIKGGVLLREVAKVYAVDGVSFEIENGQTLGVVGESGCGKSTLGRTLLKLHPITEGEVTYDGTDITHLSRGEMRPFRRDLQIIFQDPMFSLNPRHTVEQILREPLEIHGIGQDRDEQKKIIAEILETVGLREAMMGRYPHEFSGGQRQRLGIARALILRPKLIVADEPVSALDVSIQSQILNLLVELRKKFNLTYIFISHDLAVVEYISTHVAVMYLGKIVEITTREALFKNPSHPYTQALISAIPIPDPTVKVDRVILQGDVPSPINPPSGCRFHPRCPYAVDKCRTVEPELKAKKEDGKHHVSCHLVEEGKTF